MKKISRRTLLQSIASFPVGVRSVRGVPSKPNIVMILADDLGYGDLGVTGCTDIRTPCIDALARQGVRFAQAYSNAPVCSPTRAALLTGKYQQRLGIDRVIYVDERNRGLTLEALLLPEVLKTAGYRSAIIGKWHLGYPKEYFPTRQGFDEFFGFVAGNVDYFIHTDRLGNHDLWRNETELWRNGQYFTKIIADEAIHFLDRRR
ncbi:sulfatase-like hydrolase/transferase, partial [Acidobacteria bacterium AH-259-O06]|nr:sulfatase-like hydrolase/transferase [Acidobacteria bacterium AH-259-O06]